MSDTPISDSTPHNVADLGMLCRRLERELDAASKERDDALMMLGMYRMKSDEQKQRIKRLEEAFGLVLKMRNNWLENQEDGYEGAYYAFVKGNDSEWEEIIQAKEAKL